MSVLQWSLWAMSTWWLAILVFVPVSIYGFKQWRSRKTATAQFKRALQEMKTASGSVLGPLLRIQAIGHELWRKGSSNDVFVQQYYMACATLGIREENRSYMARHEVRQEISTTLDNLKRSLGTGDPIRLWATSKALGQSIYRPESETEGEISPTRQFDSKELPRSLRACVIALRKSDTRKAEAIATEWTRLLPVLDQKYVASVVYFWEKVQSLILRSEGCRDGKLLRRIRDDLAEVMEAIAVELSRTERNDAEILEILARHARRWKRLHVSY